ncbi:MAG TPA: 16S rRNA (adenine(1518)-N(6)/adenine(1519)-N(6))-dimethyltransferase RsmA [Ktedonobacterales bacterium]|nr:16S rRNA (adenine(1518)-N(6)/adenine(1519)-N(6))-dimethyltransferase RsmA [Ktedonobacterales bacterium]
MTDSIQKIVTTPAQAGGDASGFSGDLTDMGTLKRLLARHGMTPSKGLGQHLLISRRALNAVVRAADLSPDDSVLEVGAGPGVLTRELAQRARRVVAVELDHAVLPVLRETTAGLANVEIIPRNLLEVPPEEVFGVEPYKLVANLPYYITSLILRYLLESANPPRLLVVMVQREVAERLVSGPGEMSLLALSVQFYGTPRIVSYVPATAFYPPPKVDSAIVRVDLHPAPLLDTAARDIFFELIHAGFAEKRKQLHNSLTRHLGVSRETIDRWLAEGAIDPMRRPQTLSLEEWLRLARTAAANAPA